MVAHLRRVPDEKGFMIGSVAKLLASSIRSGMEDEQRPVDQKGIVETDNPNEEIEIQIL